MTQYFVTAWCERTFTAQCDIEATTAQEALQKARTAIQDTPAEECDSDYAWDEWRVDTADKDGVLLHTDDPTRYRERESDGLIRMVIEFAEIDAQDDDLEAAKRLLQRLADEARRIIKAETK